MQTLTNLIKHPDLLDAIVTDELRALLERYPYFQAARLLYVRGLYQQQDDCFGTELRKAALYMPDRRKLFELIEGHKFELRPHHRQSRVHKTEEPAPDRTQSLIDSFLSQLPEEPQPRRPRVVDASQDYMAYLLQMEDAQLQSDSDKTSGATVATDTTADKQTGQSPMSGEHLIDDFINGQGSGRIQLPDLRTDDDSEDTDDLPQNESFLTETLARIYIKQGKYGKAMEIIRRLSLRNPKKNRYFADQIRFLEKLIVNQRASE